MTMIDSNLSRRSVLAGLSGMTFCLALGDDGVRLVSPQKLRSPMLPSPLGCASLLMAESRS